MTLPFATKKTVSVSGGADSAASIPVLNASGVLDASIVNSTTTGGTATQAAMLAALNASGVLDPSLFDGVTTGGSATQAGAVPVLNASGLLDPSFLSGIFSGGGSSRILTAFGWKFVTGSGTVPPSGDHTFSLAVSFPSGGAFSTCFLVLPVLGAADVTPSGFIPAIAVTGISGTGFTLNGDVDSNGNVTPDTSISIPIPFNYLAIGQP